MIDIYLKGKNKRTFILLHGTGGNEYDLVNLARYIDADANILGIRGNVSEHGMNRFFKRFSTGQYDYESIEIEARCLHDYLILASKKYGFDFNEVSILGFSNGANIAIAMMHRFDQPNKGLYLLSPVFIEKNKAFHNLTHTHVFISASLNDPYATDEEIDLLEKKLEGKTNTLKVYRHRYGHTVNQIILDEAKAFYESI